MLYGGPLGTYLSGLSSSSSTPLNSSTGSSYTPSTYGSSSYLGSGLRRSNSRYRSNGTSSNLTPSSSTVSGTGSTSLSSYYTPQLRRKYGTPENEAPKATRYSSTRTQPRTSTSPIAPSSTSSGTGNHSGIFHYSRWSPNTKPTGTSYAGGSIGTSASWNSDLNTASNSSIDYKRLYEAEKLATDELRAEIAAAQREMHEVQEQIEASQRKRRSSDVEQRKLERRISECEEELKVLEKLRAESERLRAEHRALVRVVSRLNREQ